jgi:hypothetical protein
LTLTLTSSFPLATKDCVNKRSTAVVKDAKPGTVEISIADIDALHLAVKALVVFKDLLVSYDEPFGFEMNLLMAIHIQTLKEIDENFQLRGLCHPEVSSIKE